MKITDIIHSFPDGSNLVSMGMCRVRTFLGAEGGIVVLLTDIGKGISVTNAVERIIQSLFDQGKVFQPAIFVEHYERTDFEGDTFDIVTMGPNQSPNWKKISKEDFFEIANCSMEELANRTSSSQRLLQEIDRIRFAKDPFIDSPYQKSPQVIKRHLEINQGMISKASIATLVTSDATEQELQRFLKTDLSIFGEAYAKPDDEYICFSEFPILDGAVDFAVFTGRSRMDVILIEVKGANFNLVNSNHPQGFNHKINDAAEQIRTRVAQAFMNPIAFRDHVHKIRARAESGERICNSFLGPIHKLGVDPKKDINIRTVVIGGRTKDDALESNKRHNFEARVVPPIRIESWETWLRRLQRE